VKESRSFTAIASPRMGAPPENPNHLLPVGRREMVARMAPGTVYNADKFTRAFTRTLHLRLGRPTRFGKPSKARPR
jgi:hypothetical protein